MGDSGQSRVDARFDIFKNIQAGDRRALQWIGDSESFSGAMFRVELAAAKAPGKYVLHNQRLENEGC
jgi:hypothetical protein